MVVIDIYCSQHTVIRLAILTIGRRIKSRVAKRTTDQILLVAENIIEFTDSLK